MRILLLKINQVELRMVTSDCAHAQSDLGKRSSNLHTDRFCHDTACVAFINSILFEKELRIELYLNNMNNKFRVCDSIYSQCSDVMR